MELSCYIFKEKYDFFFFLSIYLYFVCWGEIWSGHRFVWPNLFHCAIHLRFVWCTMREFNFLFLISWLIIILSYRLDHSARTFHMRPCLPFCKRWVISSLSAPLPSLRLTNVMWHREAHGLSSFCLQKRRSLIDPHDPTSHHYKLMVWLHNLCLFYSLTVISLKGSLPERRWGNNS